MRKGFTRRPVPRSGSKGGSSKAINSAKAGNIVLTFILLTALAAFVAALLFMVSGNLRQLTSQVSCEKALYTAEAGIQKALWYLRTDPSNNAWYTTGLTEIFSGGQYTIKITDGPGSNVTVISTGEVQGMKRTLETQLSRWLPPAFNYAVFSNAPLTMSGNAVISGEVFVNGNTVVGSNNQIINGEVYHPAGTTISGGGTYTDGGVPSVNPDMPTLNTSSYDSQLSSAAGYPPGNASYTSSFSLGSSPLYVHGNISISGNTTITGSGKIIATGSISISGNVKAASQVDFISGSTLSISGNADLAASNIFSTSAISLSGNEDIAIGTYITPGTIAISGNGGFSGFAYAGTSASLAGNAELAGGSIITNNLISLSGNSHITFKDIGNDLPVGFGWNYSNASGTWKEY